MAIPITNTINGYEIVGELGVGGFGKVYQAQQTSIQRQVAIKIIKSDFANRQDFIRRFEAEAHVIARLEHPHIVPLYDYWRDPTGAYLVMRYLRSGSLRQLLDRQIIVAPVDTANMLDQIASGLDHAHRNNVVHRDIKPGNILLDEDGNAYVADFGIAKDLTLSDSGMTDADGIVGSLDYLSPEQARSEEVTARTDIYSLGVTVYEMLVGKHPFHESSSIERLYKHINEPIPEIVTIDANIRITVNEVIQTATQKDPEDRYQSVLEFARAFREAVNATDSLATQLTPREYEVLLRIVDGLSNKEIADELFITVGTVKNYVKSIYKKLGVRSRVQVTIRAHELNLLNLGVGQDIPTLTGTSYLPEPQNPYKGLRPFDAADHLDFFGREALVQKLLNKMTDDDHISRFLAIVGPSGSGKSSLVRAGIIPAIWNGYIAGSDRWYTLDIIPGAHPIEELEIALTRIASKPINNLNEQLWRDNRGLLRASKLILPDDNTEMVLVIDQFEEVFTLVEDEKERQQFLDILHSAVTDTRSRIRVIITIRADFYDKPLHYPDFGELVRSRMETVLPLSAKELERAIVAPAERQHLVFEEGLVAHIISEINYHAGALPLLQYALTELFEHREGLLLTQKAYQQIGGAVGALAKRAEKLYSEMDEQHQQITQQMFMRLITLGEGAGDTRRRANHAELLSIVDTPDLMDDVIDLFTSNRLLLLDHDPSTRQPTVEVAHEAILREWDHLRQWLNESRDDIRKERQLAQAAQAWDEHKRDVSFLLRGTRLEQFEKWQVTSTIVQTPLEQEFIASSLEQHKKEVQVEIKRKENEVRLEVRSRNFLYGLVAVFAIATLISVSLALFALVQRNNAIQARDAEAIALQDSIRSEAEFRSIALAFSAQSALDDSQPDVALALASEAIDMQNPPNISGEMFIKVSSETWLQQRLNVADMRVTDAIFFPDGQRILTTSQDGRIVVWDSETGQELQSLQIENTEVVRNAIHPDGNIVVVPTLDGVMYIWNLESDVVIEESGQSQPAFNQDGTLMLTESFGQINIWETGNFTRLGTIDAHPYSFILGVHFSPDDSLIISSSSDGTIKVWDAESYELLHEKNLAEGYSEVMWIWNAFMLPDMNHILAAAGDGRVILWNWRTDETIWTQTVETAVQDIAISPDAQTFVMGLNEPSAEAQLREVATGEHIRTYQGHTLRVQNVDFSPDGNFILTASNDGTVGIWRSRWEGNTRTIFVNSNNVVVWHPTQPLIATVGTAQQFTDTTIRLIDTITGEVVFELDGHTGSVRGLAFSPDGSALVSGGWDGKVSVWDVETGQRLNNIFVANAVIHSLAVNNDGQVAINYGNSDERIALYDLETGERIASLIGHSEQIFALAYSPDNEFLYSGSRNAELYQWNVESGEISREFVGHTDAISDVNLNSDGSRLVSASTDQKAIIWDVITGEALVTLQGHTDAITNAEFSPDDDLVMTAGVDGRIILWDAETGEVIHIFATLSDAFRAVATFSPDGTQIVSSINDILTFWDLSNLQGDYKEWIRANRYIPDFTCYQRQLYGIEPLCEP